MAYGVEDLTHGQQLLIQSCGVHLFTHRVTLHQSLVLEVGLEHVVQLPRPDNQPEH